MCCPTSDGAAAVLVCNHRFLERKAARLVDMNFNIIKILGLSMKSDPVQSFHNDKNDKFKYRNLIG